MANEHEGTSGGDQGRIAAASSTTTASTTAASTASKVIAQNDSTVRRLLRHFGVAPTDLPDAQQEVYLVVWRRLHEFEGRSSITTWLYTICRRVAKDQRRRAYRHHECSSEFLGVVSEAPSQESVVEARERLTCVQHAYRELSADKQEALISLGIDGDAVACIASRQRCPEKTVFSRLYAARDHLRRSLRGSGLAALAPESGLIAQWRALRFQVEGVAVRFAMAASCAASIAILGAPPEPVRALSAGLGERAIEQIRRVPFVGLGASHRIDHLNRMRAPANKASPCGTTPPQEPAIASMEFSVLEVQTPGTTLAMEQVGVLEFEVAFATEQAVVAGAARSVASVGMLPRVKPRLVGRFNVAVR